MNKSQHLYNNKLLQAFLNQGCLAVPQLSSSDKVEVYSAFLITFYDKMEVITIIKMLIIYCSVWT